MGEDQVMQSPSVDEFGGDVSETAVEAQTKSAYLGAPETESGAETIEETPSKEAEKPTETEAKESKPEPKPSEKKPAEKPADEKEGEEAAGAEDLPEDAESAAKLRLALSTMEQRLRGLSKVAADAGREKKALQNELGRRSEAEKTVDQLLSKKPDLIERISALLDEGNEDKKEAKTNSEKEEISEEQLETLLEEMPETKPLVDALKKSMAREVSFSQLVDKLEGRIANLEKETVNGKSVTKEAQVKDRRYKWYNTLHTSYDALKLPKDLDAETLDQMLDTGALEVETDPRTGELKAKDPYFQKILERAAEVARIAEFAEKGPYGTGTPDQPYYPDIEVAYEVLLRMGGKAHSERTKMLLKGRKEAAQAFAEAGAKAPSISDIKGREKVTDVNPDPQNADEAEAWMEEMNEKLTKEDRDLTNDEEKKYKDLQKRFNL